MAPVVLNGSLMIGRTWLAVNLSPYREPAEYRPSCDFCHSLLFAVSGIILSRES